MSDYDTAYAAAKDEVPFSNGSQGYDWMARWCDRCTKNNEETELWCPLLSVALLGRTPVEWTTATDRDHVFGNYTCSEFEEHRDPGDDPPPDPGPGPFDEEQPGQTDIFGVFAEQITEHVGQLAVTR